MPEPRNNRGKIPNTLTPMTRCGLGAGCNTCMGLPREGQAVVAFPSAPMLPISEYHKLETPLAHCRHQTQCLLPLKRHFNTSTEGPKHQVPPPHFPLLTQDSATSGTLQKGAAKRGLPEAIQAPAGGSPQPTGQPLNFGSC